MHFNAVLRMLAFACQTLCNLLCGCCGLGEGVAALAHHISALDANVCSLVVHSVGLCLCTVRSFAGRMHQLQCSIQLLRHALLRMPTGTSAQPRRYTYKAMADVGGFTFENGKAVSEWLEYVLGKAAEPPSFMRRDAPPERKRKRKGDTAATPAAGNKKDAGQAKVWVPW